PSRRRRSCASCAGTWTAAASPTSRSRRATVSRHRAGPPTRSPPEPLWPPAARRTAPTPWCTRSWSAPVRWRRSATGWAYRSPVSARATRRRRITRRTRTSPSPITSTISARSGDSSTRSPAVPSIERDRAQLSARERRTLLFLLGYLTFSAVYVGVVIAPVLTPIASEFDISTGTAGLVVAAYGAPGILVALLAGPYSDRFGRKRFLVAGSVVMGVFTVLAAFATSFGLLVALLVHLGHVHRRVLPAHLRPRRGSRVDVRADAGPRRARGEPARRADRRPYRPSARRGRERAALGCAPAPPDEPDAAAARHGPSESRAVSRHRSALRVEYDPSDRAGPRSARHAARAIGGRDEREHGRGRRD